MPSPDQEEKVIHPAPTGMTSSDRINWRARVRARTWRGGSSDIRRFGVIIGAMKAGTSSLYSLLSQHPEVAPSRWKEPEFFTRPERWSKFGKSYTQLWDFDPDKHTVALEASTGYTKFPEPESVEVPERMSEYSSSTGAEMRLIYLMRDPVERAESQVAHQVARNRARVDDLDSRQIDHAASLSMYAMQLDRFRPAFRDRMLLLNFEDLRDPGRVTALLDRCGDFLGLAPFEFRPEPPQNTRDSMGAPTSVLTDEHRDLLKDRLDEDVRRLRDEYGVDVSRWRNFSDL